MMMFFLCNLKEEENFSFWEKEREERGDIDVFLEIFFNKLYKVWLCKVKLSESN